MKLTKPAMVSRAPASQLISVFYGRCWAAKVPRNGMSESQHRVGTIGAWTIALRQGFEFIDNGDSWQAYEPDRVVYVSSKLVRDADGSKTSAEALCAVALRAFGSSTERHSHSEGALCGGAQIAREDDHWELKGVMCAAGVVATCVIDFWQSDDKDWAIATWKSLRHP